MNLPIAFEEKMKSLLGVISPKSTSAVRGEYVQLIVTSSPAAIGSGVPILIIVSGCIVASTPPVALGEMAAADTVTLNAKKIVNTKVSAFFICLISPWHCAYVLNVCNFLPLHIV